MVDDDSGDDEHFRLEGPADVLRSRRDTAILCVRLSLAVNALRASHRHFLAVKDARGPGGERDRLWAFMSAAAYVKEAMNILTGTKNAPPMKDAVEALARRSGATYELIDTIKRLLAGTHPTAAVVTRVRNKLAFHWDPQTLGEWADTYSRPTVLWFDASAGSSNGETLYRAAADAAVYSIIPPTEAELALPDDEQTRSVSERLASAVRDLTDVMKDIADYFELATATFLKEAGAAKVKVEKPKKTTDTLRICRCSLDHGWWRLSHGWHPTVGAGRRHG